MADKLELPQSNVTKLVKEGASEQIKSGIITSKETKEAF